MNMVGGGGTPASPPCKSQDEKGMIIHRVLTSDITKFKMRISKVHIVEVLNAKVGVILDKVIIPMTDKQ